MIVVDASVWVSYLLPSETNHEVSRRWLSTRLTGGQIIVAPVLLLAEVGGAIARQTRPQLGQRAIDRLLQIPSLRLVSIDHASGIRAAQTAVARRLRGADALYVETAATLNIPLVSWDRQQLDRAAGLIQVYVPE